MDNLDDKPKSFETCQHDWALHIDVDQNTGSARGNSLFRCSRCFKLITLIEKCALDQIKAQAKSLIIQERHVKIGMWANVIAAVTLIIAFLSIVCKFKSY